MCVCKSQEAITIALHWVSLRSLSIPDLYACHTQPWKARSRAGGEGCKGLPSPLPFAAAAAAATRANFPAGSALVSRTLFSLLQHTGACSPKEGVVQPGWGGGGKGKKLNGLGWGRGWKRDKESRTDHLFAFSSRLAPKAIIINDPGVVGKWLRSLSRLSFCSKEELSPDNSLNS